MMGQLIDSIFSHDHDNDEPYVITEVFKARFNADCALDDWHRIKIGDLIGRVAHADNPFVPIRGYACRLCVKTYPKAAE